MRAAPAAPATADRPYRKRPGMEPLPGYRLIEPLGRGGFGEVWKCEAPGGLHKAVKFVADDNGPDDPVGEASLRQEFEAFERIKRIRHPFLLTLERVELVPGDLVMVMELADHQLQDRFTECTALGHPGVPRGELLGYVADAAEVLDFLAVKHGLQHLDIKPANLFLSAGRVKVGDFGLVRRHELTHSAPGADRGLTPKYVAPEILHGRVDPRSDQYCLALVYQELLTGRFPYPAKSPQQMMLQHVASAPDLTPLPAADRAAVGKALSKAPTDRFASCLDFVRALSAGPAAAASDTWADADATRRPGPAPRPAGGSGRVDHDQAARPAGLDPAQLTGQLLRPPSGLLRLTTQAQLATLASAARRPVPAAPDSDVFELIAAPAAPAVARVVLPRIWSVVPAARLTTPSDAPVTAPDVQALVDALVAAACPDGRVPSPGGTPARQPDGSWAVRVVVRPISGTAALKLGVVRDAWDGVLEQTGPDRYVVRRPQVGAGVFDRGVKKKFGLEVAVALPPAGAFLGEARLTGRVYGPADPALAKLADKLLPDMLAETAAALQNADSRRKAVRVPTDARVTLYPVHGDGAVDPALNARCRDVSTGGLSAGCAAAVDTAYVYAVFPDLPALAPWAVLVRLTRVEADPAGHVLAGRFRVDL